MTNPAEKMSEEAGYIIVERDQMLRDVSVFTGTIRLGISDKVMGEGGSFPMKSIGAWPDTSDDLADAFLFPMAHQALRYAEMFQPHWIPDMNRYFSAARWVVRDDGIYQHGTVLDERHNKRRLSGEALNTVMQSLYADPGRKRTEK